jgi:hypothetical protein
MRALALALGVGLLVVGLTACGGGGPEPNHPTQVDFTVKGDRLTACGSKVWVSGMSCKQAPGDTLSQVGFAETDVLNTAPLSTIRRTLGAAVYRTNDGWTCKPEVTGQLIYNTCWRGSQIVRSALRAKSVK